MSKPRSHSVWIFVLIVSISSAFVVKKLMGLGLFLCFMYAIYMLFQGVLQKPQVQSGQTAQARLPWAIWLIVTVLCAPFLWVLILGILREQQDLEQLTEYLSHLMAAAVLCIFYGKIKLEHWAVFKCLVAVASIILLPMTLWQMPHPVWQERYATYFVDPNSLGIAGFIFGSALGVAVFQKSSWEADANSIRLPKKVWLALLIAGASSAWAVSALSGTRGAWLAVVPAFLVVVSVAQNRLKAIIVTLILAALGVLAASQTPMLLKRYEAAVNDIVQLQKYGNRDTSLGTRISIYEALVSVTLDSPWLGMSREDMNNRIRAHSTLSSLNKETLLESGAHNQYLEKQVLNGVPGLVLATLLYFVPMVYFWAKLIGLRSATNGARYSEAEVTRSTATPTKQGGAVLHHVIYASSIGLIVCLAFATAGLSLVLTLKYLNTFWAACIVLAAATVSASPQLSNSPNSIDGASHV
jgi:O-antigen ligase